MATYGNRGCQLSHRSVWKDFTDDALTISTGIFFQNETVRMQKAYGCMWKGSFGCEFFKLVNVCGGNGLWEEVWFIWVHKGAGTAGWRRGVY